ncbi:MAG: hypothetical protein QM747_13870 [Nocardioides sp.]
MKIVVAPQKVGVGLRTNLATLKSELPLVVGFTEMDLGKKSFVGMVKSTLGSAYTVISEDVGAHSEEIPVAIRTGLLTKVSRFQVLPISPDVGTKGTGNDRYLVVVRFRHKLRTYVLMHTHTDAVIQNQRTGKLLDNERVEPTAKAMALIESKAKEVLDDPAIAGLVIMGDFNYLQVDDDIAWEHSPQKTFTRLGMTWDRNRVVYLAWSPGLAPKKPTETIAAHSTRNASDHAWLIGHLRKA